MCRAAWRQSGTPGVTLGGMDTTTARRAVAAQAERATYLAELATWGEDRHRGCAAAAGLVAEGTGWVTRCGRWHLRLSGAAGDWSWLVWDGTGVQAQGYPVVYPDLPGALRFVVTSLQDEAERTLGKSWVAA